MNYYPPAIEVYHVALYGVQGQAVVSDCVLP